jgi:subtilisin family serine protease
MKPRSLFCLVTGVFSVVLGPALTATAADAPRAEVRPWVVEHTQNGAEAEFFVVLRDEADLSPAYSMATKEERGWFVFSSLRQTAEASQADLRKWLEEHGVWYRPYYIINAILVRGNADLVAELARRDDVLRIEGNPHVQNALPQPDPPTDLNVPDAVEWGIERTNAPEVWALGFIGQGVVVGGQDTGIDWDHPALKEHYRGWNGSTADHDYNWHDSIHVDNADCPEDSPEPCDDHGHGTHTIGTVVGDDGAGNQVGMAPGAKWIGCRNMNQGDGTPARYLECFEFFLAPYPVGGTPAQGDPTKAPDVTNNSWACPTSEGCSWDTLKSAVEAQRAAGIMTVVSAGNEGSSCGSVINPPSHYDASFSVGSTTSSDALSSFSSRGPATGNLGNPTLMKPDIVAPGSNIRSSLPGGGYGTMSGTSMAAPHVAGAVALAWSALPTLKNDINATEILLEDAAHRLTNIVEGCGGDYVNGPNNSWGYGLVDVGQALVENITLQATAVDVDETGGNSVLEPGEFFSLSPTWFNPGDQPVPGVEGTAVFGAGFLPGSSGADYGSIPAGESRSCSYIGDCYSAMVSSSRPTGHVDRLITENLTSGETHDWVLHIGESFDDVPPAYWAYRFIETIYHHGITAGCASELFCPESATTRWQMAPFLTKSILGNEQTPAAGTVPGMGNYDCSPGGTSVFLDVAPSDPACAAIHFLANQQITVGCGGGKYCPTINVDRWQMAVFLTKAILGDLPVPTTGVVPGRGSYDCSPGGLSAFLDVLPEDPACPAIHYLAVEGITAGCDDFNYCPHNPVSRAQMAVFLQSAFSLQLYGP